MTSPEAQKILDLITSVDPDDAGAMDEIDARMWCFINNKTLHRITHGASQSKRRSLCVHTCFEVVGNYSDINKTKRKNDMKTAKKSSAQYTRSLDAIKVVEDAELEDFCAVVTRATDKRYKALIWFNKQEFHAPVSIKTEQLARLYAVVMAIDWKRKNGETND